MVAIVGAKEGGPVDEVVEQVGDLEQAGVVAWGCRLCQGHLPAVVAAVVFAVAGTVVGRVVTVVVVVAAAVIVVAAAVTSVVAVVASDPVGLLMVSHVRNPTHCTLPIGLWHRPSERNALIGRIHRGIATKRSITI
ncbi:hypothetical protein Taro_030906 [Colocasia esculenta]|uniref:Uncharacterized protein n=1 Tax=Colocasia esculenta TaxID=4460 RepID=A0A843VHJ0_COLES|nr:hypothetical protein [Colocasia esculenta]